MEEVKRVVVYSNKMSVRNKMIDILLATYNGERFLQEQLDSIFKQTYQNFHVIIRDDGSSDNTMKILKKYKEIYKNKITIIEDDIVCKSAIKNFFRLLKFSESDYVMFSDQDDIWENNKMEISYNTLCNEERQFGKVPMCLFSDYKLIDEKGEEILKQVGKISNEQIELKYLLTNNCALGCTMMINKGLIERMKKWTYWDYTMHDWVAVLLACCCGKIIYLPQELIRYRQHTNNAIGSKKSWKRYLILKIEDKKNKEKVNGYFRQASELLKFVDDEEKARELKKFCAVYNGNKITRIYKIIKYGFLQGNILKKVGLIIYI